MTKSAFLAAVLARCIAGSGSVAVGSNSPIPAAAALLAEHKAAGRLTVFILGSPRHNPFTDGGREMFDFAAQGRLDSFFLGGGEIDGTGDINLLRTGDHRFPGCYGAPYLMALVPNIVLFREEHSRRVLVPRVDFVSARGSGPEGAYRTGGPKSLVTGRAVFRFTDGGFTLVSCHPGETVETIRAETGFDFAVAADPRPTEGPTDEDLQLLQGPIASALAPLYPRFTARLLRGSHA
ncbi:CoA-transferase [Telmatospirillum siberiense]|uniref:CoA-transferase n=1 Tax=Telmatospirillum siberiense TaxID=382514 RepID=UPI001F53975D|nr:CoA-transferase [Telmatospirillum siberiense]